MIAFMRIAVIPLLLCVISAAQPALRGNGKTQVSTGFNIVGQQVKEVSTLSQNSSSIAYDEPAPGRLLASSTCWGAACIVEGTSCTGDDCFSEAACPAGSSLIDCKSEPADGGDGIQVESTKCIARGSATPSNRRRRRRRHYFKATASCSSAATSVVVSSSIFLDNQEVSAACEDRNVLTCYCYSAWTKAVCGGTTKFAPSGSICKKTIGKSSGRRRMEGGGAGAKIYALCSAPVQTTMVPTTTPVLATTLTPTVPTTTPSATTTPASTTASATTRTPPATRCAAENSGCPEPNGKGISAWFTKAMFDEMFPQICNDNCKGCNLLTYNCLVEATLLYPSFANSSSVEVNRRELAAWLGIMSQETTGGGCSQSTELPDGSCTCGPMWCDSFPGGGCEAWGLCKLAEETADTYCDPSNTEYPCVAGKSYAGRGPKQLSYNANYGQFSEEFCGDKNILLNNPERVATNPTLAWASSIWFWFSGGACASDKGEICKPGCHDVMLGSKQRCPGDVAAGRQYGLGWATNIVNGGLECGSAGRGKCDYRVHSRVKYYKRFCGILNVEPLAPGWTEDANLFCHLQKNYDESAATEC